MRSGLKELFFSTVFTVFHLTPAETFIFMFLFFKRSYRLSAKVIANETKRLSVGRLPLIFLSIHASGFSYTILAVDLLKGPPVHKHCRCSVFQRCSSTTRLLLLVLRQSFFQLFKTVFLTCPDPCLQTTLKEVFTWLHLIVSFAYPEPVWIGTLTALQWASSLPRRSCLTNVFCDKLKQINRCRLFIIQLSRNSLQMYIDIWPLKAPEANSVITQ